MPLHLLGKKSWNVYNSDNIARVKADEAAAAAQEAVNDQRMQELDAERRAAILRGQAPPPLPEPAGSDSKGLGSSRSRGDDGRGRERKRRKLANEDDTEMDIRLASSTLPKTAEDDGTRILKLRSTASDAPLIDHAGHIDLFPVDRKEAAKREKNAEAEKEKRKKEKALEDQYTMRFSNAAGRDGVSQPWYATEHKPTPAPGEKQELVAYPGFEDKDVWGNEDPRRQERQRARITNTDPFALMQEAQAQLQRSKLSKRKWADERDRELRELRATQEREERSERHHRRKKRHDGDGKDGVSGTCAHRNERSNSSRDRHRHRERSNSRGRSGGESGHTRREHGRRRRSKDKSRLRHEKHSSRRDCEPRKRENIERKHA